MQTIGHTINHRRHIRSQFFDDEDRVVLHPENDTAKFIQATSFRAIDVA